MIKELKVLAQNLTILCVDDEKELLDSVVLFCKKIFGVVLSAENGEEALEVYKSQKVDIIITDLMMPKMNGIEMISNIREENKTLPIIVLSAYTDLHFFTETIDLGIDGYLIKPMKFDSMVLAFYKVCDKISLKTENEEYKNQLEEKVRDEIQKRVQSEKMMLAQAKHAAMGEMIGMIAHQWRQPLSAITSTANALEVKIQLDRYDKEYFDENLKKITRFTSSLSSTIDDFRNFFKSDKSRQVTTLETIIDQAVE